uniref:Uncharacterized protein n=1 Tax=Oryza glumipatula TaxID=40148 RepID=A0A0E0AU23_9ORYZ
MKQISIYQLPFSCGRRHDGFLRRCQTLQEKKHFLPRTSRAALESSDQSAAICTPWIPDEQSGLRCGYNHHLDSLGDIRTTGI